MAHPKISYHKTAVLCGCIFFTGLILLSIYGTWWPGIMLVVGIPISLRQFLQGRTYSMFISLFVFIGSFISIQYDIQWKIILPVIFTVGGIHIFFKEFFHARGVPESEDEEEINKEIEED